MKYFLILIMIIGLTGCGLFGGGGADMGGEPSSTWRSIYETTAGAGFLLTQKDAIIDSSQNVTWIGLYGYIELTCGRFGMDISGYEDAAYWTTQPVTIEWQRGTLTCAPYRCETSNVTINLGQVNSDFECILN